jgi:hypothetical protein
MAIEILLLCCCVCSAKCDCNITRICDGCDCDDLKDELEDFMELSKKFN